MSAQVDPAALLSPYRLGSLELPNRVFVPGHTTNYAQDNAPSDTHVAYHAARARGGAGLVIVEAVRVHPTSAGRTLTLGGFSDKFVPAYARLTEAIHREGAKTFAQIIHLGREASAEPWRAAPWGPSAIPWAPGTFVPHAMTRRDLVATRAAFRDASRRMLGAGFDGLEVHLGHGHLLHQFLSAATNTRDDEYGGSAANRLRFVREVLQEIYALDTRAPIGIRVSAHDWMEGGLTPDIVQDCVAQLLDEFPLAFCHVSHSAYTPDISISTQIADASWGSLPFTEVPAQFKKAFPQLPIMAECRVDDLANAASLLADGVADMVGLARAHIADPDLVAKTSSGRADTVRSCIACNQACIGRIEFGFPVACVVNPEAGLEAQWQTLLARARPAPRRVAVIGGGPAGMEAALSAARRGHHVTLFEASAELGGQWRLASALPNRSRFRLLIDELRRDLARAGVTIRLNTRVSPTEIAAGDKRWDAVVVATGARHQARVLGTARVHSLTEALADTAALGRHVAIIDELGSWQAYGLAEALISGGASVRLISSQAALAWKVPMFSKFALYPRLKKAKAHTHLFRRVTGWSGDTLVLTDPFSGTEETIIGVTALVDVGAPVADDKLYRALETPSGMPAFELRLVGDAYAPRSALEAIYEGRVAGCTIGDPDAPLPAQPEVKVYF